MLTFYTTATKVDDAVSFAVSSDKKLEAKLEGHGMKLMEDSLKKSAKKLHHLPPRQRIPVVVVRAAPVEEVPVIEEELVITRA